MLTICHEREDFNKILQMREDYKKGKYYFGEEELPLEKVKLKIEPIFDEDQKIKVIYRNK